MTYPMLVLAIATVLVAWCIGLLAIHSIGNARDRAAFTLRPWNDKRLN